MRGTLPALVLLAASALTAGVYVSRQGHDNAPTAKVAAAPGGATAAAAGATSPPASAGVRHNTGKVAAFVYKSAPEAVPTFPFFDSAQQTKTIETFKGKVILLNLWATWCGPCREEMPSLDRLQKELGSDKFEVVAVSVDKNGFDKAREFMKDAGVASLNFYADPSSRAAHHVKAVGMPATLLVDEQGREIGRLLGPAEWDSSDAKRLIEAALR